MKQIDGYVNSVYSNIGGNNRELQELKAEMKNHLLEAVHELTKEGKSEQEAITIAIKRFGGEQETRSVIRQLFTAQRIFAKWVLYVAIALLLISSTVSGSLFVVEQGNGNENQEASAKIDSLIQNQSVITEELQEKIAAIVKLTDQISQVQIFKTNDVESVSDDGSISYFNHQASPVYQYDRGIWGSEKMDYYYVLSEDWFLHFESKHYASIFDITLTAGITAYAVLFTIWAIINAYHHKRLNIGWIIGFALFNVLAYLIYWLSGRKRS